MLKLPRLFYEAWTRFSEDDGWAISSHIALSGLTALFPFLIFVGALVSVLGPVSLADQAAQLVFDAWPDAVAAPIAGEIHNVLNKSHSGLATLSAVLALYFASSGVEAVRVGLNRAYDVKDMRAWYWLRLESIAYVLVGALALVSFSVLVLFFPLMWNTALSIAPQIETLSPVFTLARLGLITLVLLLTLVIAHKYLAAGRRRFRETLPGIALTFALWLAFGEGFGLYLARFSQNYLTTYAGLASVMIALVFLYVLASIFIFGGELNAAILRARNRPREWEDPAGI